MVRRMAISRMIYRRCPTGTGKHPVGHPWRRRRGDALVHQVLYASAAHPALKPLHYVHLVGTLNHYRLEVEDG